MELGESLEDYLECIYVLHQHGKVRSIDVAKRLEVSKPSVNKAINVLKEKNLLTQEAYGDIRLTQAGIDMAKSILNRHLTIKQFLTTILNVSEENADIDACKIEHIICDETFNNMVQMLEEKK